MMRKLRAIIDHNLMGWLIWLLIIIIEILMQPKQQRIALNQTRERPLQKSMFLPEHYPQTMPKNASQQELIVTPMKKSLTTVGDLSPSPSQHSSSYIFSHPYGTQPVFDNRAQSQHQILYHPGTGSLKNLNMLARSNIISQPDQKNFLKDKRPSEQSKGMISNAEHIDIQQIIAEAVTQIKEKHLPAMVKSIKKELYDDLHHFRVEFQLFKDQVKGSNNSSDLDKHKKDIQLVKNSRSPKKQLEIQWIESQFRTIEERVKQFQARVCESLNLLNRRFDNQFKDKDKARISPIKSSINPIQIEYKESFVIPSTQNRTPTEILISRCTYFIDKQGNLMDAENRYLLNQKGNHIQLDEKHIRLLEQHRILQK